MALVYGLAREADSTIRYIGITTRDLSVRFAQHKYDAARGSHLPVHRWIRKYGDDVVTMILHEGLTLEESQTLEKSEIANRSNLLNLTLGGEGRAGFEVGQPTREKIAASKRGKRGVVHTNETKTKISEALKGRLKPTRTPEHRANIALALTGRIGTNLGRKMSDEQKAKISATKSGQPSKPKTLEHRAKLSAAAKAQWERKRAEQAAATASVSSAGE